MEKITLREAREAINLSILQAAGILGIPEELVLEIEKNPETTSLTVAATISVLYNVPLSNVSFSQQE